MHRAVWTLVNVCYPILCVCGQMCQGPEADLATSVRCPPPQGPSAAGRGSGQRSRGVDVPGVLVPELCSLPRTFPLSIAAKEHHVHWLLSRLVSPTPLLPAGAAGHFLTRTRSTQGAKPWGQSGRERRGLTATAASAAPGVVQVASIYRRLPCAGPMQSISHGYTHVSLPTASVARAYHDLILADWDSD